ncbi:ATP-binding cassette domain-containing protein [Microbacterium ulmi]|uniref:ATP-binding cassette domain-containing protein n=1 Tax=Microbacterium ulmi TaxID=179095 RepID=UPI00142450D7|nr:lipopolysaccharide transport system ATP-binding protein [Microbacterium ulmi]
MGNGSQAIAIRAIGLGKTYRIASTEARASTLVEAVSQQFRRGGAREKTTTFDALHDLDFEIPWGEAVGIIGRNGAGKSTLLKVLTRITAPTRGRLELDGRVGSLLEVGTGFHPELTGRENIFLNGALLGMRRKEIAVQFDQIVDFSGVEKFLDTPVKRYSSGMYVRLAFAVAAHLETEILAIDEVLAVGDAEFQQKSLAKMREVAKSGRTVLFVSHQAQTVRALCTSALYLQHGRLVLQGTVDDALTRYRESFDTWAEAQSSPENRPGTGEIRIRAVEVPESYSEPAAPRTVQISMDSQPSLPGAYFISCHISDLNGTVIAQCDSRVTGLWFDPSSPHDITLTVTQPWFKPGRYSVDVFACRSGENAILDAWEGAASFEVLPHPPYEHASAPDATESGIIFPDFSYRERTP